MERVHELDADNAIAIVAHDGPRAARASDFTGFTYMGRLIEFERSEGVFTTPTQEETEHCVTGQFG